MTSTRTWYGATYPHGLNTRDAGTGYRICSVKEFGSKKERDDWVLRGHPAQHMPDYRRSMDAKEANRVLDREWRSMHGNEED